MHGVLSAWVKLLVVDSSRHAMHPHQMSANYGLYFTFCDRVMGTMASGYDATFDRVTGAVDERVAGANGGCRAGVEDGIP
jgi:sterol desaturase/sphingolipid hydroxylase (fatty acid hydroxylase superfamily)